MVYMNKNVIVYVYVDVNINYTNYLHGEDIQ